MVGGVYCISNIKNLIYNVLLVFFERWIKMMWSQGSVLQKWCSLEEWETGDPPKQALEKLSFSNEEYQERTIKSCSEKLLL